MSRRCGYKLRTVRDVKGVFRWFGYEVRREKERCRTSQDSGTQKAYERVGRFPLYKEE
jgi:hypothetical protein